MAADDDLGARIDALTTRIDQMKADADRLRQDHDQLSGKLRYPGTTFLVDLEYKLVYDATVSIGPGSVVVGTVFETLPGTLHAVYVLSAYCPDSNTPVVICDGSVIVAPPNTVSVGIQRQRQTGPTRIEAAVIYDCTAGVAENIAVRVWRRLGMGS